MLMSRAALLSASALTLGLLAIPAIADEEASNAPKYMRVDYDQAAAIRLDQPAKTVVVGNASIAEALLVNDRTIYVQGRIFGNTNLIALDENGTEIYNTQITVGAPLASQVTLYRGALQHNLACSPRCEHTVTMGDADVDEQVKSSSGKMEVAKSGTDLSTKP
jgi:Flp pilus assembly secretin CpaC